MSDWIPLKRIARLRYGDALPSELRRDGGVPVFGSGGVGGSSHNVRNTDAPAIVIGRKGSYGTVHWAQDGAFVIDTAYSLDRRTATVDLRWLYYVLHAIDLKGPSQDVGVPGLSREAAHEALVPAPPSIDEQRRIADFLDVEIQREQRIRSCLERMLHLLDEREAACLTDCVAGRLINREKKAHPILGEIPADWPVLPLRRVVPRVGVGVVVNPSSYFADEGVPFLRGSNVQPGWLDLGDVKLISEKDSHRLWRSRLESGDVVVVRAGDPGRSAVIPPELHGANCASILILKAGGPLVPDYLAGFFNSSLGRGQVGSVRYGAAQEQINVGHVVTFSVPVPPVAEQRTLLTSLALDMAVVRDLRSTLQRQIALLVERRQAVVIAAVTGQMDVTTARGVDV